MTAPTAPPPVARGDVHRRLRQVGLAGVLVMLVLALAAGLRDDAPRVPLATAADSSAEIERLRRAAALEPCPPGLGPQLPDLVLPCLDGGPHVALTSQPPGRPTLVNVWATWCAPCVDEVPALVAFAEKAGDRVGVVGVLTTDTLRSALTFADAFDMRYPSLVDDDGRVLRAFPPGPPVTLFLTAEGRVVHRESGAIADLAELEELVAEHLGVRL